MSRDNMLRIRLNDDEEVMFEQVANRYGLDIPSMVRMLVRLEDSTPATLVQCGLTTEQVVQWMANRLSGTSHLRRHG